MGSPDFFLYAKHFSVSLEIPSKDFRGQGSLVPGAREKRRSAWYTLFAHAFNLPKCGDSRLFSDSFVLCEVRVRTRYSILVRIL